MSLFNDILTKVKQSPTYQNNIAQAEKYELMLSIQAYKKENKRKRKR